MFKPNYYPLWLNILSTCSLIGVPLAVVMVWFVHPLIGTIIGVFSFFGISITGRLADRIQNKKIEEEK